MNKKYSLIFTSSNDSSVTDKIKTVLLENNLSSCIQESHVKSSYIWEGKICHDNEILLIIKAGQGLYTKIEEVILKYHNYQIPEILEIEIKNGYEKYLKWIG